MSQRLEFENELTCDIEKHFDMKKIHQLLRMVPLFEPVLDDDNLLTLLASRSEIVCFNQGDTIVQQGCHGDCMFVVKTGSVVVSIRFVHCDTGEHVFWCVCNPMLGLYRSNRRTSLRLSRMTSHAPCLPNLIQVRSDPIFSA